MFLELGINNDQIFVSETNYLEVSKVSSYEELKSIVISEYEAETFSKYNWCMKPVISIKTVIGGNAQNMLK